MTNRYAVVGATGVVVNVILWDAAPGWTPPEGCTVVEDQGYAIGGALVGGAYTPPPPGPETTL